MKNEFLKFDWITEKYEGILEINPTKCLNTIVLNSVLLKIQKEYELVQLFPTRIRAFKK